MPGMASLQSRIQKRRNTIMAELIIYIDANFGGLHTHLFESTPDFTQLALGGVGSGINGNWNDRVSSFVIVSGHWTFFKDIHFSFQQGGILGPGLYSFVQNFGIDNDALSSVRLVSST
jgi:Beta/Gamma crystallin